MRVLWLLFFYFPLFYVILLFWVRVSVCSLNWPQTHNPPASTTLRLKMCATVPSLAHAFWYSTFGFFSFLIFPKLSFIHGTISQSIVREEAEEPRFEFPPCKMRMQYSHNEHCFQKGIVSYRMSHLLKWKAQANIWKESWASRSLCWPWFECILVRPREAMLPLISMESEAWPVRITSWLLNLCASCLASLFCVLKVRIDNSFIRLLVSFEWVKRLECLE